MPINVHGIEYMAPYATAQIAPHKDNAIPRVPLMLGGDVEHPMPKYIFTICPFHANVELSQACIFTAALSPMSLQVLRDEIPYERWDQGFEVGYIF